eukprot:24571-Amphidinium_carterae.1
MPGKSTKQHTTVLILVSAVLGWKEHESEKKILLTNTVQDTTKVFEQIQERSYWMDFDIAMADGPLANELTDFRLSAALEKTLKEEGLQ